MKKVHVLLCMLLLLTCSIAAFADVVVERNGTVHRGQIIFKDDQVVIVKTESGEVVKILRNDAIWITQSQDAQAQSQAVSKPATISLDAAIRQMADHARECLPASGGAGVAVAPLWGPKESAVAFHEAIAEKICRNLKAAKCRIVDNDTVQRVLNALNVENTSLGSGALTGRLANILGVDAALVGHVSAVGADTVTVEYSLIEAASGKVLKTSAVNINKDAEVRKLLGEKEPEPQIEQVEVVESDTVQSAVSTKFAEKFSLRAYFHDYVENRPEARYEGDRIGWRLPSGNTAVINEEGLVIVASNKKLTDEGQVRALENDISSIFINLSKQIDDYKSGEIHKDVEFDSTFYGHKPGIFHRYIIRERTDLTKRDWTMRKNGCAILYSKVALVIDGSWAKLSLGDSYVVSFGRWTARSSRTAADEEVIPIKITPYGWIRWYIGVIDIVTEPTINPPKITGWGSANVVYRSNELIDHLEYFGNPDLRLQKDTVTHRRSSRRAHTFNYP